jgi:hypothetical protein
MNRTPRDYPHHDILNTTEEGGVAHLSWANGDDRWAPWYSLCGRVVWSLREDLIADTDHPRVCTPCHKKATRRRR